jgi:hypothetical protein
MRLLEELRHLLWMAFHEGGRWALDELERKGDKNPRAAFNDFLKSEYPILGVIPDAEPLDPDG